MNLTESTVQLSFCLVVGFVVVVFWYGFTVQLILLSIFIIIINLNGLKIPWNFLVQT